MMGAKVPAPVANRVGYSAPVRAADAAIKGKVKRTTSEYQRRLGRHLKEIKEKATKKNGDFKKGWSQSRVMSTAHKCCKREMKR